MNWTRKPDQDEQRAYWVQGVHPDEPGGHLVLVSEDALKDRAELYGLASEDDSLNHIMWEHHIRLNPGVSPTVIPSDVKNNFDRVWGPGHKAARGLQMSNQEVRDQEVRLHNARKKENK